ncbi:FAD-dependent oxidoreductase [Nocardia australiensis]|uniref:FAD-dependent oxidoreductase n=1 Tax=Nocardia australiensis TaxID=2887191 RepID=UPI001D14AB2A|nr:NAD(P)/FAD-dependent oxidoreductase [Nocardia australiensis]
MSAHKPLHVIIAGGGIGGLALANGLRKAGVSVAVYERDRHRTDRLQGFRIHISPQGSRSLHELLPEQMYRAFVANSGKGATKFGFVTEQMRELLNLDADVIETGPRDEIDRNYGISRITLRQILLADLGAVVRYDKTVTGYRESPDGRVEVHFADGGTATGDVLVGADGGTSRVRAQRLPDARRVETGIVTVVGKFGLTDESRHRIAPKFLESPLSVMPPTSCGMFIAPHEFDRPDSRFGGIGGNDDAAASSPGALLDNTQPYVFWAYAAKRADYPTDVALESLRPRQLHEMVNAMTARWAPQLRELIGGTDTETVTLISIRTSTPVSAWETTRVTLLGDAIHSMTPFRGIGANVALRDARLLCEKLVAADRGARPLLAAIHDYEAQMIDYGFKAVRDSATAANQAVSDSRAGRTIGRMVFRVAEAVPSLKRKMFSDFGSE